ncbi:methyltransferase domain-containing protein [Protofrankia symbiont of Coriaria ruscifolia]|uniref:methyltransferase domain-containing protein n=1 Tax=Protofrankia symbiont of Coriaria ruscifolia TaxID=1306542 RepID=UPI0010415122|nr:OsmC family protein [Protofrankia symbiont of Coriaria ruscifolia]
MDQHEHHRYRARCHWDGSTAAGYEAYDRGHRGECPPAPASVQLSADPAFRGSPEHPNPEQLVLLAASSCQLLSFLAVAARARVDVRGYSDDAEAVMPHAPRTGLSQILLRPRIVVAGDVPLERLHRLVEQAHQECYIANSLRCEVSVQPTFVRMPAYAFGDSGLAAERLALLAQVFDTPSRALITKGAPRVPPLALDLGCGPGHSTRMLAETSQARRTVGIDASVAHVEAARGVAPELEFVVHDLTRTPFPLENADVAYARWVLAHLPDPVGRARSWLTQLAPGGVLLLEETERIETTEPVLIRYLALAHDVVAARGASLEAGPLLAVFDPSPVGEVVRNDVREWPVALPTAAALFALNLRVWGSDPAMPLAADDVASLQAVLDGLAASDDRRVVTWHIRQMIMRSAM